MGSIEQAPERIPTVDISPFIADSDSPEAARVVQELSYACSEYGFFYLTGHGVPEEQRLGIFDCIEQFASLSQEEKMDVWVGKCLGSSFRGYEPPALQLHKDDLLPDTKEVLSHCCRDCLVHHILISITFRLSYLVEKYQRTTPTPGLSPPDRTCGLRASRIVSFGHH